MFESIKTALGNTLGGEGSAERRRLQALPWGAHWSRHPSVTEQHVSHSLANANANANANESANSNANANANVRKEYEWGSYRPGVYFGMKQITHMASAAHAHAASGPSDTGTGSGSGGHVPVTAVTGFMWGSRRSPSDRRRAHVPLRHNTEGGKMSQLEWLEHDGASYGSQAIQDQEADLRIATRFATFGGQAQEERGIKSQKAAGAGAETETETETDLAAGAQWVQRVTIAPLSSSSSSPSKDGGAVAALLYLGVGTLLQYVA